MNFIRFMKTEFQIIKDRDPAIHTPLEVFLYPSFRAILYYRVAHKLYLKKHYFVARWISQRAARKTGIEIHPGAKIGKGDEVWYGTLNKEVILFAVIGVGVITFFILIFQRTSMKQKKMREIASRDGLTQLYNKAGTEQEKLYKRGLLFYTNELRGKGLCTSPKRLYIDQ